MTVREHLAAINEATTLHRQLASNPNVGRNTLGAARDLLNRVTNLADDTTVKQALRQLRDLVEPHQH